MTYNMYRRRWKIVKSKRKGFIEFNGFLSIMCNKGNYLLINHNNTTSPVIIKFSHTNTLAPEHNPRDIDLS